MRAGGQGGWTLSLSETLQKGKTGLGRRSLTPLSPLLLGSGKRGLTLPMVWSLGEWSVWREPGAWGEWIVERVVMTLTEFCTEKVTLRVKVLFNS